MGGDDESETDEPESEDREEEQGSTITYYWNQENIDVRKNSKPIREIAGITITEKSERLSREYARFIDFVFAFVVAQSLREYADLLFPPLIFSKAFWALLGVYLLVSFSWIGYHRSLYKFPYRSEVWAPIPRFFSDFLTVATYTFLLHIIRFIRNDEYFSMVFFESTFILNGTSAYIAGFGLVFFWYIISGVLRQREYDLSASAPHLLIGVLIIYIIVFTAYETLVRGAGNTNPTIDALIIGVVITVMLIWRVIRGIGG